MQSEDEVILKKVSVAECFASEGFMEMVSEYRDTAFSEMQAQLPKQEDYQRLEDTGNFFVFAVYVNKKIVGFTSLIKQYYPHSGTCFMTVESIFACKAYRHLSVGTMLINAAKDCARREKALGLMFGAPYGSRLAEVYMRKFKPLNVVFWCEV